MDSIVDMAKTVGNFVGGLVHVVIDYVVYSDIGYVPKTKRATSNNSQSNK